MHARKKIFKGASFLSVAEIVNQGCSLVRNIILARFLAKADFGVAALLGMILTLFEMCSKMSLGQQVVQSKHGDEPAFVDSVHFTQFAAGALSSVLILLFAWPLAHFFSGPQYLASIMLLALIPLVTGLSNLGVYHRTRQLNFAPLVLSDAVPSVLITLAAWPLAVFFRDYRAVLFLMLAKAVLAALMSHLLAGRRYALRFDPRWGRESLTFGWPLLLTGFIQFGNFQGDSMVVAASYPLSQLGEYSVAMTLAMTPGFAILRVCHSVSLPVLADVQADPPRFLVAYGRYAQGLALLGCCMTLGMLFCGEQIITLVYGSKYAGVGALASWLLASQAVRLLRAATVAAAMARGDTLNNLITSVWRLSGLALAVCVGLSKGSLTWFAVTAFAGETVALAAAILRLRRKHSVPPVLTLFPAGIGLACVLVAGTLKNVLAIPPHSILNWAILVAATVLSLAAFLSLFHELRSAVFESLSHIKDRLSGRLSETERPVPATIPAITGDTKD